MLSPERAERDPVKSPGRQRDQGQASPDPPAHVWVRHSAPLGLEEVVSEELESNMMFMSLLK